MLSLFDIQKKNKNKTITELIDEAFSNKNAYSLEPRTTTNIPPETQDQLQPKLEPFKKERLTRKIKAKTQKLSI